jgi:pimeloyl-ACP methyl ester carboxylesterase
MKNLLTLAAFLFLYVAHAQPYLIGSRNITFNDPSRNRNIGTQIRYPGATAGANAEVAAGVFPVLVMGHGFAMGYDVYSNLWNYFVPKGYIVALPTTEGGLLPAPSHGAFGLDLAFVAEALQAANLDPSSPFFGKVAPATALMGHSMGGGASFLGAANNTNIQALVNFAPAETDPSAVAAAANVSVPTMVIAGANDCVTPIPDHQGPMYAALTTSCRAFVNITGASHCQFAESNFNCNFGELTCSPSAAISRGVQHGIVNDFAGLWLDHFLKGVPGAFEAVQDSIANSTRVTAQFDCLTTGVNDLDAPQWSISPVPANDRLVVRGVTAGDQLRVLDILGREVLDIRAADPTVEIGIAMLPAGTYRLLVMHEGSTDVRAFVVAR